MTHFLKSIFSPILSLFFIIVGNGFLLTLIPIRAGIEGFPADISGYLAAAYFSGILLGAIQINKMIMGVGHIRAFAFFASMIAVLTLVQGIFVQPLVWILARFLFGLSIAGVFITIESWLLVKSSHKMRGIALSIYMTVFYAAQSAGQLFIGLFDLTSLLPFCFVVIMTSLSVLPLTITKTKAPIVEEHTLMSPFRLLKIAPLAVIAALFAGLFLGPIYGLLPVYAQEIGYTPIQISWVMGSVIFGGLVFQWPIGALSDRMDRRKVLLISSILASALVLIICLLPQMSFSHFLIFSVFFGGGYFAIYPLSISHACDQVDPKDIIATTGAVLLSYGAGSIIGPIISSYGMRIVGPNALFYFLFIAGVVLSIVTLIKVIAVKQVPKEEKLPYSNVPQTTPIAYELDPRSEEPEKDNPKHH